MRRYFHRKINRWDAATNLLLVEKRQEVLRGYQREKREYVKRKNSFWIEGGKQEAAKKVPRISTVEQQQSETTPQQETLTLAELKKMKVTELLSLLTNITGRTFNNRRRKQDLIDLYFSENHVRQDWRVNWLKLFNCKTQGVKIFYCRLGQTVVNFRVRAMSAKINY